jgi:hypothetical protein
MDPSAPARVRLEATIASTGTLVMPGPKETVYDDEIAPLMTRIIEIANREKIGMHATFFLDRLDDVDGKPDQTMCTTHQEPDGNDDIERLRHLLLVARHGCRPMSMIDEEKIRLFDDALAGKIRQPN